MFSQTRTLMGSRPAGRYQIGSDIVLEGSGSRPHGGMCMNSEGNVVALFVRVGADDYRISVRRWNGSSWAAVGSPISLGGVLGAEWGGICLDAAGTTLAVGTPNIGSLSGMTGSASVYSWNGSSWAMKGFSVDNLVGGVNTFGFGEYVSLSSDGSRLAVGSPNNLDAQGMPAPLVTVYDWNGASWVLVREYEGSYVSWSSSGSSMLRGQVSVPLSDQTGRSVRLSADGGTVAWGVMGSRGEGAVAVNTIPCETCGPSSSVLLGIDPGAPQADGPTYNPAVVSLSGDGRTLAVSDAAYLSGGDAGIPPRTRVWRLGQGGLWSSLGSEVSPVGNASLNHDGSAMMFNDGYVYRWDGSSWAQADERIQVGQPWDGVCAVDRTGTVVAQGRRDSSGYVCRVYRWN